MTVADATTIRLGWAQGEVFQDTTRFRVVVAGRRFGKTYLAGAELRHKAYSTPHANLWYIAPTYRMAKDIAWTDVKKLCAPWAIKTNETELAVTLLNGSTISLHGADNPDRLVGRGLDHVVLDEFAMLDSHLWDQSIRPALADRQGSALFITTPRGYNWAYDLYLRGRSGTDPNWRSWTYTTIDGGRVSAEELAEARANMDPRIFAQEFEASFETLLGRVYSNFDRTANVRGDLVDPGNELYVGMDFNVHPMTAVIACAVGDECHVLDALELPISNTEEMAAELKRRYPTRTLVACPDPSGNARKTSAPVGQTDFTILRRYGFKVLADPQAPLIVDRVNNVQANLLAADGRRRLLVHPRATAIIRALDGLTYKEGTNLPDKSGGLDHITDALGYLCWQKFNRLRPTGWVTRHNPL